MSADKRIPLAARIKYSELCQILNDIKNNKKDEKRRSFDKFLGRWYDAMVQHNDDGTMEYHTEDSFYPAMRLICPTEDKIRKYGLGVMKLIQAVSKGLAIPSSAPELKDFTKLNEENAALGLAQFVVKRTGKKEPSLTISDVNEMLDHLSDDMNDGDGRKEIMRKLLKEATFDELYWIFLILTKKIESTLGVHFGMYVLKWFHPGCYEKLQAGATLQEVIDEVCSASIEERPIDTSQILCKKIKPMLLKRITHKLYDFKKIIKICGRPFYLETKFDGEHLLLHKYGPDGCKYSYFTRNQNDYTSKFGADCETNLSCKIHKYFKESVRNCVLDCEVLIWERVLKRYVGKNQRASDGKIYDVKHLEEDAFGEDSSLERCLAVFDILYLNDKSFVDKTLEERVGILDRLVFEKEDPSVIFVSKKHLISKREEFKKFYDDSMRAGHEGIVVKGLQTKYKMGSRAEKNGWFKIKPDYGSQTNLDLAIAAARVDKNGKIETFYVAARDGPATGKIDMRFRIMAPLMSSIKKVDFEHLMNIVHGEKGWLPAGEMPYWITNPNLERHQNRRYVRRDQMVVVEVRASGVKDGNMQFPRIVEIRHDKDLEEIDTVTNVFNHEDKLRERHSDGSDDERVTEPANKRRRELQVHENYKLLMPSIDQTLISAGLKGKKVCVLQGDKTKEMSHQQLQEILASLGAGLVANPSRTTDFLIATNPKHIRVGGAIKKNAWHVVNGTWLLKCKKAGKLLPWTKDDLLHESDNAKFDLFDANLAEEQPEEENVIDEEPMEERVDDQEAVEMTTREKTPEIQIEKRLEANRKRPVSVEEITNDNIDDEPEHEPEHPPRDFDAIDEIPLATSSNLFDEFVFYIHESVPKDKIASSKKLITSHAGKVSEKLNTDVTHVVVEKITNEQMDDLFNWNESKDWIGSFVNLDWLKEATGEDDRYLAPINLHQALI